MKIAVIWRCFAGSVIRLELTAEGGNQQPGTESAHRDLLYRPVGFADVLAILTRCDAAT